ncbi:glycoprotein suaprga1 [Paramyrothecium foliicola]|nr:glycoprotein suaprga1 [Paramyrothecium foliicola]
MPTTLHKTRKQIAKKRNGQVNALHEKSRDSMRLHKASVRDQRLEKLAAARNKKEQPIAERVAYFYESIQESGGKALELTAIQDLITTYIHKYDEEYDELKKARRPGRPPSAREDLLKLKISALETEYQQGFSLPDITTDENAALLQRWEGAWSYLSTLPWCSQSSRPASQKFWHDVARGRTSHQFYKPIPPIPQFIHQYFHTGKMMSVRSFARSAPRAVARLTTASLRQSARPSTFLTASSVTALRPARAAFTTSSFRRAAAGETDDELSAKLESEIQIEEEMKASEQQPASIKDFLENGPFELIDTPGQEVVKLTRSFGDEKITVSFSIADITSYDPYSEDAALEDEEFGEDPIQNSNKQSHVQSTGGARSARAEEEFENDLEEDLDEDATAPINLTILIEKPGKTAGALTIDATAQEGNIVVENMFYYEDAKIAKVDSPESAQKRADIYPGPPFGSLDEDLQVLMDRFLEERGITQALAVFVPDYVDVKEQREYLRWLNNVKGFVDA